MSDKRIYLSPPHVGAREFEMIKDAFDSNWIAPAGPHVAAFEREIEVLLGIKSAVAVSSGTAALHLALLLLGVGRDDLVLTSTLTFVASVNPIMYLGAQPVFIDSEASSWNLDPNLLEDELRHLDSKGQRPAALIGVDLFGQCVDWDPVRSLCARYGVPIIEDAAESFGSTYRGRPAGTFGKFGVLSFNGNKIITTSGGGMLVSEDHERIREARYLSTQARDPAPHYLHSRVGYNYCLSNLSAALGRGQLQSLEAKITARRANFAYYQEHLEDLPGLRFMPEVSHGRSTRWLTCLLIDPEESGLNRQEVRSALEESNIESRPVWKPMHLQPLFTGCRVRGGQVSEGIFDRGLCLPSGSNLKSSERERVVRRIRALFANRR